MLYVLGLLVVAVATAVLAALVLRSLRPVRRLARAVADGRAGTGDKVGLLVARRAALGVELARRRERRRAA